jgi:glycerol-3-phosphate O-acyltransferase/dihydroxyacetone phosphate acyltransferase
MLQRLIISTFRMVANTFFRHVEVAGIENVPEEGPVIFAGNHPNALMDGWLLVAKCGRWPVYFLANAKLWKYRALVPLLNATGAVPVYRREDHGQEADNSDALERLYELLESGECIGIFPEGVSHVESQLVRLKTGTARIALTVADRGKTTVPIIPVGLNYIERHRFRSQAYIHFGEPISIDDEWLARFRNDAKQAAADLTDHLADALRALTVNAPDWRTFRVTQTARRLYKPASAQLTPGQYVRLNRRFVSQYLQDRDEPEVVALTADLEDYQARLDLLGLKDYQLRRPVTPGVLIRKVLLRGLRMLILLPLAIPGAILHLPIGWAAATVGERFSYEEDDIATLKAFSSLLLLPVLYLAIALAIGMLAGFWWGVLLLIVLPFSFLASVRLIEAEIGLLLSMVSVLRLAWLGREVENLRETRGGLVQRIRERVEESADPNLERIFTSEDFNAP